MFILFSGFSLIAQIPNDPFFKYQITMNGFQDDTISIPLYNNRKKNKDLRVNPEFLLNFTKVWEITTGSKKVIVALLEDGFFYEHEDIIDNIWENPGEIGLDKNGLSKDANGIDDDQNGYVDDVMGYDFIFNDPDPDPYIYDGMDRNSIQPAWHSIGIMGIIGAKGNNRIGIAGINWDVSMMLLKIGAQGLRMNELDPLKPERIAKAIKYAVDNGARIINWSGFINHKDSTSISKISEAIRYAEDNGVLLVTSAGNYYKNIDKLENFIVPTGLKFSNIIRVGEIDFDGTITKRVTMRGDTLGSSYGKNSVEVAAIAKHFTTNLYNNISTYRIVPGGTSNSAPVVTGIAALMLSVNPSLTPKKLEK